MPATSNTARYNLVSAFTSTPFGGNPALVVFLDPETTPLEVLQGIARNFYQPMVAFVKPLSDDSYTTSGMVVVRTSIRYITFKGEEVALCGHASIAAAAVIRSLPLPASLQGSDREVGLVEFETFLNPRVVPVFTVPGQSLAQAPNEVLLELGLPAFPFEAVDLEERKKIVSIIERAFALKEGDGDSLVVEVKKGGPGMEHALLVEVDVKLGLATANVADLNVFADTGYQQNVVTSLPSPGQPASEYEYVYRMFSPAVPGGEDSVCGSAQCIMAPYWYQKKGLPKGTEITSHAASPRGGVVKIIWEGEGADEKVKLRGSVTALASGELYY